MENSWEKVEEGCRSPLSKVTPEPASEVTVCTVPESVLVHLTVVPGVTLTTRLESARFHWTSWKTGGAAVCVGVWVGPAAVVVVTTAEVVVVVGEEEEEVVEEEEEESVVVEEEEEEESVVVEVTSVMVVEESVVVVPASVPTVMVPLMAPAP